MRELARAGLVVALLSGCTCGSPAEAPIQPSAPNAVTAPTAAAPRPAAPTAAASSAPSVTPERAAPPRPSRDALRTMREALSEGRRLARAGDHAAAMPHFERAIAAVHNPRAMCEAGFVAHRAGLEERAEALIDQALDELPDDEHVTENLRVPLAMCLYNAALALEAADELEDALATLDRSLALRENAAVAARRAAVEAQLIEVGEDPPPRPGSLREAFVQARDATCGAREDEDGDGNEDEADACALACREITYAAAVDNESCLSVSPSGTAPRTWDARLLAVGDSSEGTLQLAVQVGSDTQIAELASSDRPAAEQGSSEWYEVSRAAWDAGVLPGGEPELVIEVHSASQYFVSYDDDDSYCQTAQREGGGALVICTIDTGALLCGSIPTSAHEQDYEHCEPMDEEAYAADDVPQLRRWRVDIALGDGRATITAHADDDETAPLEMPDDLLGEHDLLELLRRSCVLGCGRAA